MTEATSTATPTVSVVIPTLNRAESLARVVRYFLEEEPAPPLELIIIDQSDSVNEELKERSLTDPRLVYRHVEFQQTTRARNLGVLHAKGHLIVFSEDDVLPTAGLLAHFRRQFADPSVQAATGPVLNPGQQLRGRDALSDGDMTSLASQQTMAFDVDFPFEAQYAAGGNCCYRRDAILALRGFDLNYVGNAWGEELEFSHRFRKTIGPIYYNPAAAVVHYHVPAGGSRNRSRFRYVRDFVRNSLYTGVRIRRTIRQHMHDTWACFRRLVLNRRGMFSLQLPVNAFAFVAGLITGLVTILNGPKVMPEKACLENPCCDEQ